MKAAAIVVFVFVVLLAGVAIGQEYVPWETGGQICPDRVLAERLRCGLVVDGSYLPYSPEAEYAFGCVIGQVCPERALASRLAAGPEYFAEYLPYTAYTHYAPDCVTGQVCPERALAERVACGMCGH
jgi:hypothetical protein